MNDYDDSEWTENEIKNAWFADGYHTDEFENIENFKEWLGENSIELDNDDIVKIFGELQEERTKWYRNQKTEPDEIDPWIGFR